MGTLYDSGQFWIALLSVVIVVGGVVVNVTASVVGARFFSRRASENAAAFALQFTKECEALKTELSTLRTDLVGAIHDVADSLKEHERTNARDFERVHDRVTDANDRISKTREDLAQHPFTCLAATRLKQ